MLTISNLTVYERLLQAVTWFLKELKRKMRILRPARKRPGPSVYLPRLQIRKGLQGTKTQKLPKEDIQKEADI